MSEEESGNKGFTNYLSHSFTQVVSLLGLGVSAAGGTGFIPFVSGFKGMWGLAAVVAFSVATINFFLNRNSIKSHVRLVKEYDPNQVFRWEEIIVEHEPEEINEWSNIINEHDAKNISNQIETTSEWEDVIEKYDPEDISAHQPDALNKHADTPLNKLNSEELQKYKSKKEEMAQAENMGNSTELIDAINKFDVYTLDTLCRSGLTKAHNKLSESQYSSADILSGESEDLPPQHLRFRGTAGTNWFHKEKGNPEQVRNLLDGNEINHANEGLKFLLVDPESDVWESINQPVKKKKQYYGRLKWLCQEYPENTIEIRLYRYKPFFRLTFIESNKLILQNYVPGGEELEKYCYEIPGDGNIYQPFDKMWDITWDEDLNSVPIGERVINKQSLITILSRNSVEKSDVEEHKYGQGRDEVWDFSIDSEIIGDGNNVDDQLRRSFLDEAKKLPHSRIYGSRHIDDLDYDPVEF